MSLGLILVAVAVGVGLLVAFWDKIREWLTGVVADFIESTFGAQGRAYFTAAVVAVDKVIIGAREAIRKVVNVRFGKMDKLYKLQEFDSTANYTKEELDEIDKNVVLTQTFVQQS